MADPLSVGAGVVGLIVPALHGSRLLLDDLRCIIDAPKAIETLKEDICSLKMALTSLQAVKDVEWGLFGNTVVKQSKATIHSCTKACGMFRTDLQRWTKHSDEGKLSWQDRANVGFFKQRRIKAISDQLQTCQISINSVVGIVQSDYLYRLPPGRPQPYHNMSSRIPPAQAYAQIRPPFQPYPQMPPPPQPYSQPPHPRQLRGSKNKADG